MVKDDRLIEEIAKMAFIEDRVESVFKEATLMRVSDDSSREKIFKIMLKSGDHRDELINSVENLEVEIADSADKLSDIADLLLKKEIFFNRSERDILRELLDLENNLIDKYELISDLLDNYQDDEVVNKGEIELEVGEVRKVIDGIIADEERHAEVVGQVLFKARRSEY